MGAGPDNESLASPREFLPRPKAACGRTFRGIAWKVLSYVSVLCRHRSPHHACSAFPRARSRQIWSVVLSYLNIPLARAPRQETGILRPCSLSTASPLETLQIDAQCALYFTHVVRTILVRLP